jgi:zinc protease
VPSGTVASVKSITREQMQEFWAAHYGPGDSALVFAGDVTESEAKRLAEKYFGGWSDSSGSARNEVTLPPAPAAPEEKVVLVDKPGSPQTALYAFGLGVPESTQDLLPLEVMNYTLGGSFGSRINMNLREVHGYTYGAFSRFLRYRAGGTFFAGGLVRTDVTAAAAKELMGELNRIGKEPPSPEELKIARDASIQSIPAEFETTGATASAVSSLFLYHRPLDYFATLPEGFAKVTAAQVEAAARAEVHPGNLLIVAVGDKSKIEAGLKEANLAPVVYADPSGNPLP